MKRLLDERDVERARTKPPEDTRAYFRGHCLVWRSTRTMWRRPPGTGDLDLPGRDSLQRVPTLEPLRGTRNRVKELLDRLPVRRKTWSGSCRAADRAARGIGARAAQRGEEAQRAGMVGVELPDVVDCGAVGPCL